VLGVHAFAQCLIQFSKAARKRGLTSVAVDALNRYFLMEILCEILLDFIRLHTIPNLPVVDGFQKLREQVLCCLKSAKMTEDSYYYREVSTVFFSFFFSRAFGSTIQILSSKIKFFQAISKNHYKSAFLSISICIIRIRITLKGKINLESAKTYTEGELFFVWLI